MSGLGRDGGLVVDLSVPQRQIHAGQGAVLRAACMHPTLLKTHLVSTTSLTNLHSLSLAPPYTNNTIELNKTQTLIGSSSILTPRPHTPIYSSSLC